LTVTATASLPRRRDPRLDFFRGLGMFIIYIAHVPWNWWTLWIPARFGFSDATEIFVFCSGMASAIAFGKVFDNHGWMMGTARVAYRAWQVYWAHICQFLVIAAGLMALHQSGYLNSCCNLTQDYVNSLNLWHFYNKTPEALPGLLTLTYVPNYFDILPMYIVILALLPLIMLASRISIFAAFALSIGLWLASNFGYLDLPAEPWSEREWFFNPFAWQLVFFTGFAFMRGWIPAPPVDRRLVIFCLVVVLVTIPFAYFRIHVNVEFIKEIRADIRPLWQKTDFGLFRYLHFLALAYLAWVAAGKEGARLLGHGAIWDGFVRVVQKVGQQSLAVFLASLVIAQAAGILRDMPWGRGEYFWQISSNLFGFAALIAVAYSVAWFKSHPWAKAPKRPTPEDGITRAGSHGSAAGQPTVPGATAAPEK